jgi:hypothetical protein
MLDLQVKEKKTHRFNRKLLLEFYKQMIPKECKWKQYLKRGKTLRDKRLNICISFIKTVADCCVTIQVHIKQFILVNRLLSSFPITHLSRSQSNSI